MGKMLKSSSKTITKAFLIFFAEVNIKVTSGHHRANLSNQKDTFSAMNERERIDVLKGMHYRTCARVDILEPV